MTTRSPKATAACAKQVLGRLMSAHELRLMCAHRSTLGAMDATHVFAEACFALEGSASQGGRVHFIDRILMA